ncbi:unnamed protein product [Danaus chrysippus]|uniref:(African queen) hypothetical protein n=1 Tax=Danaus chrysippus TaxID=151541 RepID=A0A8J2QH70_9NEOP|nr:unnamed protein product [Danaus chrysippus]
MPEISGFCRSSVGKAQAVGGRQARPASTTPPARIAVRPLLYNELLAHRPLQHFYYTLTLSNTSHKFFSLPGVTRVLLVRCAGRVASEDASTTCLERTRTGLHRSQTTAGGGAGRRERAAGAGGERRGQAGGEGDLPHSLPYKLAFYPLSCPFVSMKTLNESLLRGRGRALNGGVAIIRTAAPTHARRGAPAGGRG